MAKHFFHGKRRGTLVALSAALCATLTLGMLAACGGTEGGNGDTDEEEEEQTVSATDTQLLRNGNFEYFSERDTQLKDKRSFISSPTSWSFTSGSPSSITASGIVNTEEWANELTKSAYSLVPEGAEAEIGTNESSTTFTAKELTEDVAANAEAHWEEASVYDRLLFYKYYGVDSKDEFSLYGDYKYSIDYEDVQYLKSDFTDKDKLPTPRTGAKSGENSVLMIHNKRISDDVLGTAQYYTSSTTITIEAGAAAEISVWVRTDDLYHWFDAEHTVGDKEEVQSKGGAYIGVINTVGGQTLPEMQIKNIRTGGEWQQYTIHVRGNTYATTTFRIKLGLGQGTSSDNRYENVDGYAFFDDIVVTKTRAAAYEGKTANVFYRCDINSDSKDKIFDRDKQNESNVYALDLLSDDFNALTMGQLTGDFSGELTSEKVSENKTYYSYIGDNRTDGTTPEAQQSVVGIMTYGELKTKASSNGYLKNIFKTDFEDKFPFTASNGVKDDVPVLMLLSTNGAAYTATVKNNELFTLQPNTRKIVSFFVKTWDVRSGKGAGITLVDGETKTSISPFDSKTVNPVTIDSTKEELTDIYQGWVQCFFFVSNDTETAKTFYLNFTFGTTTVQGTSAADYCDGYAAFTDFKMMDLTKTQYGYASTGTYAQKVSLTSYAQDDSHFDTASASSNIKEDLAAPSSFTGAVAGSNLFTENGNKNEIPAGVYAGLLRKEYAENYMKSTSDWAATLGGVAGTTSDKDAWWGKLFGENGGTSPREANQPLVIVNTSSAPTASYGFISRTMETSISANSSQRISLRVKVSKGATAYIYLLDTSDLTNGLDTMLSPAIPALTYWYDDDGNILRCDPDSKDFNKKTDVLFYLEANGLYSSKDSSDTKLYTNFANYTKDENGNLITSDKMTAFYYNEADGKYYGYLDDDGNYTQEVTQLPTEYEGASILRYNYQDADSKKYESVIAVTGTDANADKWIDVNFYVRTGSSSKTYRLEVWAGDRTNAKDGLPAGGYVFFDAYSSGSISNFEALRDGDVGAKGLLLEQDANKFSGDPEKLNENLALYYTFSFFDSASYLRHDREHEEVDYNKWENYKQSSYEEGTVWLKCYDEDGTLYGADGSPANPSYSIYLDFTPLEQSVTASVPEDNDGDEEPKDEDENNNSETNIWLVLSSSVLALVTIFAVVAVIVRTVLNKRRKNGAPAKKQVKRTRPAPVAPAAPEAPAETPSSKKDNGPDPYDD